jgi:hypothetical protein
VIVRGYKRSCGLPSEIPGLRVSSARFLLPVLSLLPGMISAPVSGLVSPAVHRCQQRVCLSLQALRFSFAIGAWSSWIASCCFAWFEISSVIGFSFRFGWWFELYVSEGPFAPRSPRLSAFADWDSASVFPFVFGDSGIPRQVLNFLFHRRGFSTVNRCEIFNKDNALQYPPLSISATPLTKSHRGVSLFARGWSYKNCSSPVV